MSQKLCAVPYSLTSIRDLIAVPVQFPAEDSERPDVAFAAPKSEVLENLRGSPTVGHLQVRILSVNVLLQG